MDIFFHIGLYCNLKRSIAIIASCKTLWEMRHEFYNRKHLMYYHKPILNFWSPEQHFYASGTTFSLFITDITMYMEISYLYEYNNTVRGMMREEDHNYKYTPMLTIENRWLVVCYSEGKWTYGFYRNPDNLEKVIKNIVVGDYYVKYSVIDLKEVIPCWSHFNIDPYMNYYTNHIFKNSQGKIESGE